MQKNSNSSNVFRNILPFEIIVHQPNINVYSIEKEDIYDTIRYMVLKIQLKIVIMEMTLLKLIWRMVLLLMLIVIILKTKNFQILFHLFCELMMGHKLLIRIS